MGVALRSVLGVVSICGVVGHEEANLVSSIGFGVWGIGSAVFFGTKKPSRGALDEG